MIRFAGIRVAFGDHVALPGLDLQVEPGEFFTLLGPSGCGKTTALRTLAGFVEPAAGEVYVDGRAVTRLPSDRREVGMVFQNYALFPTMSVRENIAFGLRVRRLGRAERDRLVTDMAQRVELREDQLDRDLTELSGGQQQRVAIARALVLQPKILLLDEPLSNLDAKLRQQLRAQLKELQSRVGITTLYVTHDQDEALAMSDRIAVFAHGRVEQVGTPQEVHDASATETVCRFVGQAARLSPAFVARLAALSGAPLSPELASYLRMEKVGVGPGGRPGAVELDGVVVARTYHGLHSSYDVEAHGCRVTALVPEDGSPQPVVGEHVRLRVHPASVLQYDAAGARVVAPALEPAA